MVEFVADAGNKRPMVHGVDMLRILAAVWVALYHGAAPNLGAMVSPFSKAAGNVLHLAMGNLFNGSAAVAIFFIISGFCIHYPNVGKPTLDWRTFACRRGVRIGLPMLAILAVALSLGGQFREIELNLFWSLYCELIYYAIYPLLFEALKRVKLQHVFYGSVAISAVMLVLEPRNPVLWSFGVQWTWLFCYPGWLLGALLAQNFNHDKKPVFSSPWVLRGAMLVLGAVSTGLKFHTPIGIPWTIAPILAVGYFWVRDELLIFKPDALKGQLEKLGKGSYTLYLVHVQVLTALAPFAAKWNPVLFWLCTLAALSIVATAFYFAIERPAHKLAQRIKIKRPAIKPIPASE